MWKGYVPDAGAEILGNGTDLGLYVCKAVPFDLIQAGIDLDKDAHRRSEGGLAPLPVFQGGLQVQIVAGGTVGVDTLHSPAAEHHHGDAGRHGQCLLGAGEHHVGAPTLHTDVIGQKCTDGIHHQHQTVFTAKGGDHVHIVQNAGGRLVHIHQKARVALSGIGGQIGGVRAWPCRSSIAVWGMP